MATRKTAGYVLTDSPGNPQLASVDDLTLDKGGEPVELTDDQAKRLRSVGVHLTDPTAKTTDDDA
jgi:hypothetical protein